MGDSYTGTVENDVRIVYFTAVLQAISSNLVTHSIQSISSALERLDVPLSASEIHGLCCGLLCSLPSTGAKTRWFTEILDAASLAPESVSKKAAELKILDAWFAETLSSLNGADLDFTPALPEDDTPASYRIKSLGEFCGGFTYGIGIALSQRGQKPLPTDTREIIEDFQAIDAVDLDNDSDGGNDSGIDGSFYGGPDSGHGASTVVATMAKSGQSASDEDQEVAYIELLEYVRVGVLLVLEELRPVTPATQEKPS